MSVPSCSLPGLTACDLAGPVCTLMLSDTDAGGIKIENSGRGDGPWSMSAKATSPNSPGNVDSIYAFHTKGVQKKTNSCGHLGPEAYIANWRKAFSHYRHLAKWAS